MYAVIADVHLGHISREDEEFFFKKLKQIRKEGLSVIWLGDTFDLVWMRSAYTVYKDILKDEDTLLIGNHDFSLLGNRIGRRVLVLGNTVLTHGDYLDFGFFTARMEKFWTNLKSLNITAIEVLAQTLFPRWKFEDANAIFRLMTNLDSCVLKLFSHEQSNSNIFTNIYTVIKLFYKARKYLKDEEYEKLWPILSDLPKPDPNGHMFGYFSFDLNELYKRFNAIYTPYTFANTVLIGHMHRPGITTMENGTKFGIVGSWQQNKNSNIYPTIPILDKLGNIIEIREFN